MLRRKLQTIGILVFLALALVVSGVGATPVFAQTVVDVTAQGSSGVANRLRISHIESPDINSGTGNFDPVLTLRSSGTFEVRNGYNTDGAIEFFTFDGGDRTRSLRLEQMPQVVINGELYYELELDVNESTPGIALTEFRIFTATVATLTGYNTTTNQLAGLTAVYDMDAGVSGDLTVHLYDWNAGSGKADYLFYIPEDVFAGLPSSTYVYIYVSMGTPGNFATDGGFEEWNVAKLGRPGTASIEVKKYVSVDGANGPWHDAEVEPGPETVVGMPVHFRYVISNTGLLNLYNIGLTDNLIPLANYIGQPSYPACPTLPLSLTPGQQYTCTFSSAEPAIAGQHVNTATVTGQRSMLPDGTYALTYSDTDKAHYFGKSGTIVIEKKSFGGTGDFQFTTVGLGAPFTLTTTSAEGEPVDKTFTGLVPGTYTITEQSLPAGFDLSDIVCSIQGGSNSSFTPNVSNKFVSITVAVDETVKCAFHNTKRGSLTVVKVLDWDGATPFAGSSFNICVTGPSYPTIPGDCRPFTPTIGSGWQYTYTWDSLIPGTYTVTEPSVPNGWQVVTIASSAPVVPAGGRPADPTVVTNKRLQGDLQVVKTAATSFTREFSWEITKTVEPAELHLFEGRSDTVNYTVTVTKSAGFDKDFKVAGSVTISNTSLLPAEIMTVTDYLEGYGPITPQCEVSFPYVLAAGTQLVCPYEVSPNAPISGTNTVTVTLTNDAVFNGASDVQFGVEPSKKINNEINVIDPAVHADGQSYLFNTSGPWGYEKDLSCADIAPIEDISSFGTVTNTATISETGQAASAVVDITCYRPAVTKTATPRIHEEYRWEITKTVVPTTLDLFEGQTGDVDYTVQVTREISSTTYSVEGTITISNPNPYGTLLIEAVPVDEITGLDIDPVNASVVCNVQELKADPAGTDGDTLVCTYSAPLAAPGDYTNTATVSAYGLLYASAPVEFDFEDAPITPYFASATITDTNPAFGEDWMVNENSPEPRIYPVTFTCEEADFGDGLEWSKTYTNTASIVEGYAGPVQANVDLTCYRPSVSKDVAPSYTLTYTWQLTKSVTPATVDLFDGDNVTVTYTLEVEKDAGTPGSWAVSGKITVTNPHPTESITLTSANLTDAMSDFGPVVVTCADNTVAGPNGDTASCDYSAKLPDGAERTNTATLLLHGKTYTGTADVDFDGVTPTPIYPTATLTDTYTGEGVTWPQDAVPGTPVTYDRELTCAELGNTPYVDGEANGTITNTAYLSSNGTALDDDSADVDLTCYRPSVSKDVNTSYVRTYDWQVSKSVTPERLDLFEGQSETVTYTIEVTKTAGTDSSIVVSGTIVLTNPAPMPATLTVADKLANGVTANITCPEGNPVTVAAADDNGPGVVTCTYTASVTSLAGTTNVVTATMSTASGNIDYTDTQSVSFGAPTVELNSSVTITDSNAAYAGQAGVPSASDSFTEPFEYTVDYTCAETGITYDASGKAGPLPQPNTVRLTKSDSETPVEANANVDLYCYRPVVTKSVEPEFSREYRWEIEKSVTPDRLDLWDGESAEVDYTVTVTREIAKDDGYRVTGVITVSNPNPELDLVVTELADVLSTGPGPVTIETETCKDEFTVPKAGGTVECAYSGEVEDGSDGTNTATITVTTGLTYATMVDYDFGSVTPVVVNDTATVTDTNEAFGESWPVGGPNFTTESRPYKVTLDCVNKDFGQALTWQDMVENTASFEEAKYTAFATADVNLNCYRLGVSKNAEPTYTRTYHWDIAKIAEPMSLTLNAGETGTITYTVLVTQTHTTDSDWAVSGVITIENPAPMTATVTVTDILPGFDVQLLDAECLGDLEIGPHNTPLTCSYTATSAIAPTAKLTNTASVTLWLGEANSRLYTGETPVVFGAPTQEISKTVTVEDVNERRTQTFGPFSGTGPSVPYTEDFVCAYNEENENNVDTYQFTNTATILGTPHSDSRTVDITCTQPSVKIAKTGNAQSVNAGEPITFTITVSNVGAGPAHQVQVTDTLPTGGLVWKLVDDWGEQCKIESGMLSCTFPVLGTDSDADRVREIRITSPTSTETCGFVKNTVYVASGNNGSDEASAEIEVLCNGLTIVKETIGPDATFDFVINQVAFTLTTEQGSASRTFSGLAPGNYVIGEAVPAGWRLADLSCGEAQVSPVEDNPAAVMVSLRDGADVTCTFTNAAVGVSIEKLTNGADGPVLLVGETVTWTYRVSNTGYVPLTSIVVTDSVEGPVCTVPSLAPQTSTTCTLTGTVQAGPYANMGIVTAQPEGPDEEPIGEPIDDSDPSSYFGAGPGVSIQKLTNGADGPVLVVGETVTWTYAVSNTGNVPLTKIVVTDSVEGLVCTISSLAPQTGETCWITGTVQAGPYANMGIVTAQPEGPDEEPIGEPIDDSDPSSYFGAGPGVSIQKLTNGADGPVLLVGSTVTWTYAVSNTGNVPLTNIVVTDSVEGPVCIVPSLAPQTGVTCEITGTVQAGPYANMGVVRAQPEGSTQPPVEDQDPSSYFGAAPGISIQKYTNGIDADTLETAPELTEGETVTWTYVVSNTGNVTLTNIVVTDDIEGPVCAIPSLAPQIEASCELTGTVKVGQYVNMGTATGQPEGTTLPPVSSTDPSRYVGEEFTDPTNEEPVSQPQMPFSNKLHLPTLLAGQAQGGQVAASEVNEPDHAIHLPTLQR